MGCTIVSFLYSWKCCPPMNYQQNSTCLGKPKYSSWVKPFQQKLANPDYFLERAASVEIERVPIPWKPWVHERKILGETGAGRVSCKDRECSENVIQTLPKCFFPIAVLSGTLSLSQTAYFTGLCSQCPQHKPFLLQLEIQKQNWSRLLPWSAINSYTSHELSLVSRFPLTIIVQC